MLQVFTHSGSVHERSDHTDSPARVFHMNTRSHPKRMTNLHPPSIFMIKSACGFQPQPHYCDMAINAAVHTPMTTPPTITTRPVHTEASPFKSSPNREPPRPQQWQKMAVVSMKDFNLADIRSEFDCNKAGWASVDIEIHFTSNDGLLMD